MKRQKLIILLLIMFFTVLECTALRSIRIIGIKPDLLLLLVLFFGLYGSRFYALGVGVLCGMFVEATSGIHAGVAVGLYSVAGLVLTLLTRVVYKQRIIDQIIIAFIATFLIYLGLFFSFGVYALGPPLLETLIYVILPASCYTACVAPFLFYFLKMACSIK